MAIQPHSDPLLCPVATYNSYKFRIACIACVRPHPVLSNVRIYRLVRGVYFPNRPIGAEWISKHIWFVMNKISRPASMARPRARALGSTFALAAGASINDILMHCSWALSTVFDTFYRLF
ncbi:hypothetical protein PHYBLDRAFT_138438 [Phycomyces blakesleeanus NRRL 1555(-)]|uniref:Uncharacterized protein n=1 Tax=Phycomyces blakesleeanus (strain ATCC 8743b / DSM 1359 / FGSC 10004 / NBRC 33097 / NRRL 1555) TaxID=763407 RepID=A0A162V8M0_PHYB8|nr:hypothetical protein PHYBLDRAFT_138438 [Phycomyces blakesleeanus NRRL 1555(-)]OAD80883.1 hypothetical protein PHYBLDRAFT_138438 [Phycomyces blakesleeanus NRRL 1555(-)]|eukprot:XP_018298923.1 hypothetical protein PHYBLDRAFT_138438 [Phycomyces blakesleeanus NRRL 1555(-)]